MSPEAEITNAFTRDKVQVISWSIACRTVMRSESFVERVAAEGIGTNAQGGPEDVRTMLPYDRVFG